MPIRPEMAHRYPKEWPAIREGILGRAGHACECRGYCSPFDWGPIGRGVHVGDRFYRGRCAAPNGVLIQRNERAPGIWTREMPYAGDGLEWEGILRPPVRVVLTIAHLFNSAPEDVREDNLAALCQFCHLRLDRQLHAETRAARRKP